jgi:branched-chain amino acid transport system ATP-binding protein
MVFSIADRITVLHQGNCIADDTPAAVRMDRRVQEVYLGEDEDAQVH